MDEKKVMKLTDAFGKETEYEILSAFQLAQTGRNYVVYTDNTTDENGNLNVFASIYYPDDDTRIDPVETDDEWDAVEAALENLKG